MRLRAAVALSIVSASLGAGLVACFDLFHSTSGILDACQLDADACNDAGTDFCAWEGGTAYANAATACTWLDTCEGTFDRNEFGECMARALLAYDCEVGDAAPPLSNQAKRMWDALWQARSCVDVDHIVFPNGVPTCPPGQSPPGCQENTQTRVFCTGAGRPAGAENCALWDETCDPTQGCVGCFGCVDSGGIPCMPDASATCMGDTAVSCPAGVLESINCAVLLQQSGTCNAGPLTASAGVTSPCYVDAGTDAGAGGCVESCSNNGSTLTVCARGATYPLDCTGVVDASCVPSPEGGTAACVFSDQ